MKVAFAVVWLLSNGSLEGEPWKLFADMSACVVYRNTHLVPATLDRLMFFDTCVDTEVQGTLGFFQFNLTDGLKDKK